MLLGLTFTLFYWFFPRLTQTGGNRCFFSHCNKLRKTVTAREVCVGVASQIAMSKRAPLLTQQFFLPAEPRVAIARNGRQNPYILIWLGPSRRTGRRRGSVTCTETSPIQSQWRFRSDCLLPLKIGTSWCGRILHSIAFVLFCLYLSKKKRKKKS